ncbi:hypothetical protein SLA2020_430480 [Shorea laevis]
MLKVACLPSHLLEKLVARKKRRGSEAVYEALLPPCSRSTRLVATLIQKVTDGSRLSPVSATVTICHSDYFIHKPFFIISIVVRSKKKSRISLHSRSGSFPPPSSLLPPSVRSSLPFSKMPDWSASANVQSGAARCLADPLLPIRVGLTQKLSKKEWNHWRVVCSSHLGKDD